MCQTRCFKVNIIDAGFINKVVCCVGPGLNAFKDRLLFPNKSPINKQYLQQQHAVWQPEIFTCEDETGSTRLTEAAAVTTDSRLISFPFLIPRRRCCLEYSFLPKRPLAETWTLFQFFLPAAAAAPPDHRSHDGVKRHLWRWRQQLWARGEGGPVVGVHVRWWILWSFSSTHLILLARTTCIQNTLPWIWQWISWVALEVFFSYSKDLRIQTKIQGFKIDRQLNSHVI